MTLSVTLEDDFKYKITSAACTLMQTDHNVIIASNKCCYFECLSCWSMQNQAFYRTRIFGIFFLWREGILRFLNGNSGWPCSLSVCEDHDYWRGRFGGGGFATHHCFRVHRHWLPADEFSFQFTRTFYISIFAMCCGVVGGVVTPSW